MWWSSLIVVQAFALGQGFLPPVGRLNLTQAVVVMVLAGVASVVMFSLNGEPGLRYGIPYAIQARTSFGVRGSKFVELLRAVPAIVWCGIGTWIGALSFDGIITQLTGLTAPAAKYVYFVASADRPDLARVPRHPYDEMVQRRVVGDHRRHHALHARAHRADLRHPHRGELAQRG